MSIKSIISLPFAKYVVSKNNKWKNNAVKIQHTLMLKLLNQAQQTVFGKDHKFLAINSYSDFKKQVPIRDYEELKPYIQQIIDGGENILWPGQPTYFCKTSGTTSGTKYIPITRESMLNHIIK